MGYVLAEFEKPLNGVDVYVVTVNGVRGIAQYWDAAGRWISKDKNLDNGDRVKKWKYANAT